MSKAHPPELKKFMDKKISLRINGSRQVEGILCGFDPFMNLVLDDATEYNKDGTPKNKIGNNIFFHLPNHMLTYNYFLQARSLSAGTVWSC